MRAVVVLRFLPLAAWRGFCRDGASAPPESAKPQAAVGSNAVRVTTHAQARADARVVNRTGVVRAERKFNVAVFSVLIVTAAPFGQAAEAGGAFVKVDGRESLLRSVELFLNRDNVRQVQVVVDAERMEEAKRKYGGHLGFTGVKLLGGGAKWMDQLAAAREQIQADCTHVILHDAARPAVPFSDVDALMAAAETHDAVALASPLRGTLVEVDERGNPLAYHPPGGFMNLLTPQAYSREVFLKMAETQQAVHPSAATLIKGSALNVRLGGPGDAGLAKTMIALLPKPKAKPLSSPFEEAQW